MAYTQPQLPDFCRLRGRRYRDRWNQNKNRNDRNKSQRRRDLQRKMNEDSKRRSTNLTNEEKGILYDRDYYRRLNGGFLPGENPNFELNNPLLPDGNNINSNTGLDGRLEDSKKIYYKTYATTVNLSLGILLSLYIIIKKPTYNI